MLVPLVVSAVASVVDVGTSYNPGSDTAATELQTSDIGRHPVLLGLHSRDGWNHPGPALFYALALPYRLVGSNSIGLALGALLINGLAITGIALIARRRGGVPLMLLTLVGSAVLVRALGPDFLRDPWNPYVTVLPFGLLLFLVWEMTCRQAWALPVGVGVASFCVQTHVGYAPLAIPLLVCGGTWLVVLTLRRAGDAGEDRERQTRDLVRAGVVGAAVLVVMWLPAVIQQITHSPGNVTEVVRYFTQPQGARHSLAEGYRVVAGQFGLTPEWVTGHVDVVPFTGEPVLLHSAPLPVLLAPLAIAGLAFWRWRLSVANRLVAILVLALALGVFSVTRITGFAYVYRFRWTWLLAMLSMVVVAWAGWMLFDRHARSGGTARRRLLAASLLAIVVLSSLNAVSAARAGTPQARISRAMDTLGPAVDEALPQGRGDVVVHFASFRSQVYWAALVAYLERHGIAARVDAADEGEGWFGDHRVHRPDAPLRASLTIAANEDFDELSARPNFHVVAYWGTRTRDSRAEALSQRRELEAARQAGTISADTLFAELSKQRLGSAVGVFLES